MGVMNDQTAGGLHHGTHMPVIHPGNALDKAIATVLLVSCAPLMALTAAVVGASVGSPLLFRQMRAGQDMTEFPINKFRTMKELRDRDGVLLPDEQRQTRLTAVLRRLRFDELPQLLAVWRGDMAFVGPRPLLLQTILDFGEIGRLRCSVPPGMTGWAQVNGNTRLTNRQKLALDIWYIDNRSLRLDLLILLLTAKTLVFGEHVNAGRLETAEAHFSRRCAALGASGQE